MVGLLRPTIGFSSASLAAFLSQNCLIPGVGDEVIGVASHFQNRTLSLQKYQNLALLSAFG